MFGNRSISLVIPTHQEASSIPTVLRAVPALVDEVLVVDWNSTDGTPEIARSLGARVIVEARPGYGRAYLSGVPEASGELVVTMDADGTYPVHLLGSLLQTFQDRALRFMSCSRFPLRDPLSMRPLNQAGNRILTRAANALFDIVLQDLLTGMWIVERAAWSELAPREAGWNLSQEIKLRAALQLGSGFGEAWIPYAPRLGESKLSAWQVGAQNLRNMLALRAEVARSARTP